MGLYVEVWAIGPFSADIADILEYPKETYDHTRDGARVVTTLFGIVEGSPAGRRVGEALGVTDAWDFNQHHIDNARIDFEQLNVVLSGLTENEEYLRDAMSMKRLAERGFEFHFVPNG
jgi:hypothetical protein